MTRRLVLSYLAIATFVLVVLEIPVGVMYARSEADRFTVDIERDASVIASLYEDVLERGGALDVPEWLRSYPDETGARVLVTDAQGIGILDSDAPSNEPRDYSTRPEIAAALAGDRASGTRRSDTLGQDLVYVAVPVASGGVVHGAVRVTLSRSAVDERVTRAWQLLAAIAIIVLSTTALVGLVIAGSVTRPTRELRRVTDALASGDLDARAPTGEGPPEIRELASRFNSMADELRTLIEAQQAFVADASHQLRSPLTALRLELENLVDHPDPEGLERAIEETARLGRIVDALLVLARGQVGGEVRSLRIPDMLVARQQTWQPLADERGIVIEVEADDLVVLANRDRLEQVIDNLLDNALEASPTGSSVILAAERIDGHGLVRVVDQGPGMTDEQRERAFDRFWRAPDATPGSGSGLGLSIARRLVEVDGGTLTLESSARGGITAVVTLPAAVGEANGPVSGGLRRKPVRQKT